MSEASEFLDGYDVEGIYADHLDSKSKRPRYNIGVDKARSDHSVIPKTKNEIVHPVKNFVIVTELTAGFPFDAIHDLIDYKGRIPQKKRIRSEAVVISGKSYMKYTIPTVYLGRARAKTWRLVDNVMNYSGGKSDQES